MRNAALVSHGQRTKCAVQSWAASTPVATPATLALLINPHCVPAEHVEEEFGGGLRILEVIVGGVPNC